MQDCSYKRRLPRPGPRGPSWFGFSQILMRIVVTTVYRGNVSSESAGRVFTSSANGWTKPRRSSSADLPKVFPSQRSLALFTCASATLQDFAKPTPSPPIGRHIATKQLKTTALNLAILCDGNGTRTRDLLRPATARGELRLANRVETTLTANIADSRTCLS